MLEKDARRVTFFRALGEIDHEGLILSPSLLEKVRKKLEPVGKDSDYFPRFCRNLERSASGLSHINFAMYYMAFAFNPGKLGLLLLISFLLGLASNYFGTGPKVNILLNPITLLLGWNFAVYLLLLFKGIIFRKHSLLKATTALQLINLARNIIEKLSPLFVQKSKTAGLLRNARIYFIELWLQVAKDLSATRIFFILNAMAIALTCGVISGLYLRGLLEEYQFAWFSTFDKSIVMSLGKVIFTPILFLTQNSMPKENMGAAWIHLFAVSAIVYIIVPRFLILLYTRLKIKNLSRSVEPDLPLPFLNKWSMDSVNFDFYSYSYSLDDKKLSTLNDTFKRVYGLINKSLVENIPWGGSPPHNFNQEKIPVFCFNAAQTPENEVHGEFLSQILQRVDSCMVIVDYSRLTAQQQNSRFLLWKNLLEDFVGLKRFFWANLEIANRSKDSELAAALWRKNH
jgi:hypothetical protein